MAAVLAPPKLDLDPALALLPCSTCPDAFVFSKPFLSHLFTFLLRHPTPLPPHSACRYLLFFERSAMELALAS